MPRCCGFVDGVGLVINTRRVGLLASGSHYIGYQLDNVLFTNRSDYI